MEYRRLKSEEAFWSVFIMYPFTFYIFITLIFSGPERERRIIPLTNGCLWLSNSD